MQWMFSALTVHPAVQSMSNITTAQRDVLREKQAISSND
jgi:hypothetical protein